MNDIYNFQIIKYMINIPNSIIILFALILIIGILYKVYYNKNIRTIVKKISDKNTKTIIDILKYNSKKYPNNIALKVNNGKNNWKNITYSQYYENVINFAQSTNYWLGSHVNIGIMGCNSPGLFYSYLGSMVNGGFAIGLPINRLEKVYEKIISDNNIELLIIESDEQLNKLSTINISNIKLIVYYSPISKSTIKKFKIPVFSMGVFMNEKTTEIIMPKINDVATILYNNNIGVVMTHKNIMYSINKILDCIKNKSELKVFEFEQILSYIPFNNILAQYIDIYLAITSISTVTLADKHGLHKSINKILHKVKPTIFIGFPKIWKKIKHNIEDKINKNGISGQLTKFFSPSKIIEKNGLDKCKLMMIANGFDNNKKINNKINNNELFDFFKNLNIDIYNMFGLTETCGPISITLPNLYTYNSMGYILMDIKFIKNNEIIVKGDNLFKNYKNNKELTKTVFKNNWLKTGYFGYLKDEFLFLS